MSTTDISDTCQDVRHLLYKTFDAYFYGENVIKTQRITVRLESEIREKAHKLIESGKFKNLSQVVREALKQFLESEAKA